MDITMIAEEKDLKDIHTLINKDWEDFYNEDLNKLKQLWREIVFLNLK